MDTLIKWKVYKRAKNPVKARNNLMNFWNWSKAIEHLANKLGADYPKQIADRLAMLESEEVYLIERSR